jgi:hypothetical protein
MSRRNPDDKTDPRDSTKTRLKVRGPRFTPVFRPEGSRDFYDAHLCCAYVYTVPPTFKKSSDPAAAVTKPPPVISSDPTAVTSSPPVIKKKVHHKKVAEYEKVEEPTTSNEGSTERPAKKPRPAL